MKNSTKKIQPKKLLVTKLQKVFIKDEIVLGINTSISTTQVALIQGKKNLVSKSWAANYDEMEKVMPVVDAALKKVKRHVDKIIIINGPGPFTSLRIGVALANTLAYALNAKIYSINTWEYFHLAVPKKLQKNTATILRAGGEYVAVKLPAKKTSTRLHQDEVQKFLQKHSSVKYIAGDVPAAQKKAMKFAKNVNWHNAKTLSSLAEIVRSVDLKKMRRPKKNIVTPCYLLPPKITQSKKPVFV